MKEEFKKRWLEFLILLGVAILSIIASFNESNPVDVRISSSFLAGVFVSGICEFLSRHTAKAVENILKKEKQDGEYIMNVKECKVGDIVWCADVWSDFYELYQVKITCIDENNDYCSYETLDGREKTSGLISELLDHLFVNKNDAISYIVSELNKKIISVTDEIDSALKGIEFKCD